MSAPKQTAKKAQDSNRPDPLPYLTVSIHDVTPKFESELKEIIAELNRRGIHSRSILVIPNYELNYDVSKNENFTAWLHDLEKTGDEIVHHGYEHVSHSRKYRSLKKWFLGEMCAQGCAEFQNINYEEARERLQKGKAIFEKIKMAPKGFVAPGWLLNTESERAVQDENFAYTTLLNGLRIFPKTNIQGHKKAIKAEALIFTPGSRIADYSMRLYDGYREKIHLPRRKLARVAIHPQDLWGKTTFSHALKIIERLKKHRTLVTYGGFVTGVLD